MDTIQPKKALIFSITYFPFIGGAEVALREITNRIPNIHFDLITAKLDPDLSYQKKKGNITIWRVGCGKKTDKYLYPLRAFLLAAKLQRKNDYSFVWAMMATWAGITALLFKIAYPRIKYLLTLQSGDSDEFIRKRTWFWAPIYKLVYRKADHIQAISYWLEKRAQRFGYKKKISVVPNGVDLFKIRKKETGILQNQARQRFNIPEDNKIILTSSRLVKKNDIATLIKSIHLLITEYKMPVTLIIAGPGELEAKLKDLAKNLKINDNVIFLGQVEHEEILKYYAIADVFSRPSLSEGQGVSFIEAMAAGIPIVATPVGGIPDFIHDYKTGLFVEPGNYRELALKIKLLLEDKELYDNIKNNALKLVHEKYDWNLIANKMKNIFDNL